MRRVLGWFAALLGCAAITLSLIAATAGPQAQPGLVTPASWRATQDVTGPAPRGPLADAAWLALGSVPGKGSRWEEMVQTALLDLHQLAQPGGAVAAGAGQRWNYAWPRDTAFVAVALARTGHRGEALQALKFLQSVQLADGGFEARYLLDGSGPPDDRARQSDGAGWALWSAWEVSRSAADPEPSAREGSPEDTVVALRALLDNATGFVLAATDDGRRLPQPSPDYWEVPVARTSLGTVGPLLAGLEASEQMYAALGEQARAQRSGAAAQRLGKLVEERFAHGYERFGSSRSWSHWGGGGGRDAAVTFLMPPFVGSVSGPPVGLVDAWKQYQSEALRPAGGLAPGSRWKRDGISWTPETALVAYTAAVSNRFDTAEHWMDWLDVHRTSWGSLPEKVLVDGAPAGPAPLAWTAALVVLTAAELETNNGP